MSTESDGSFSMLDRYTRFYQAIATSQTYAEHCLRLYGRDLGQHSFADMFQLARLLAVAGVKAELSVLDLGRGHGRIGEWVADETGAHKRYLYLATPA